MGRIIFITSFKGGVGKTTLTASLAAAFCALGKRVLVVDADYGNRCMDLVLGMQSSMLFDGADVLDGRVSAAEAVAVHDTNKGLFFLAAPAAPCGAVSAAAAGALMEQLRDGYDYILVDSSAEDNAVYRAFARSADDALVVSFHQSTAVRAAEKTATVLAEMGFSNIRLVVNSYHAEAERAGVLPSVLDIIERSHIGLIGVIPFDLNVTVMQEAGELPYSGSGRLTPYEAAVLNTALRITGRQVPLLKDVYKPKKLKSYLRRRG